ncbi:MAG: hypothetical protein ABIU18_07625 [Novosphingobium sp.]
MILFRQLDDANPALSQTHLLRSALLTIDYIEEHGAIGLTPAMALKRHFVAWAAEAFNWPNYTAQDLYAVNKVLNEHDFPPLMVLHNVLLSTKLARHYKGTMRLTKLGRELKSRPAQLWTLLATHILFYVDYTPYTRTDEPLLGNWDIFLNVINVEAQAGVSEERLISVLYGRDEEDIRYYDYKLSAAFYVHVLRPLCWAGLLEEQRSGTGLGQRELFTKTALWSAALKLKTDAHLQSVTCH